MRLATLRNGTRDGALIVVDASGSRYTLAHEVAANLQAALDSWDRSEPRLRQLADGLERDLRGGTPLDPSQLAAPLPRAYEFIDGSAYVNHIELVRRARGAEMPPGLLTDPLVYQGGSGVLLGPSDPLPLLNADYGLDFESEIAAVLGDVPLGTRPESADANIRLFMLANDVTYRNLVPPELAKGFGFFLSKPATAFSPFAVTKDELGANYRDGRVQLRLKTTYNDAVVGDCDSGPEMHFSFWDLLAHIATTRAFTAGSILGSGTVSNRDPARGVSCLAERRTREILTDGAARTPFMKVGDRVRIEAFDDGGRSVFGAIDQVVIAH
jgi:fumarylacetoacetate (FAA) hydrolase